MQLLRTKVWQWWDIGLLKWSVFVFGMVAGACLAEMVRRNVGWFLLAATILAIRPAIAYWKK